MRKMLVIALVLLALAGCSNDNQINIVNQADYAVSFNFRAVEYTIEGTDTKPQGGQQNIPDIPNGTFQVSVGATVPRNATSSSITPAGGDFTFAKKSTKIRVSFGSTYSNGVYAVTWNYSSTDPVSTTAYLIGP